MDCSPALTGFSVHGISQHEYWSGWPFPLPGDLPDPGIEPLSPAWQADFLPLSHLGSPASDVAPGKLHMFAEPQGPSW